MFKYYLLILILLNYISITSAEEDSLSFATYYPAPYGNYREMRAMRMAIGDNYIKTSEYDWETGAAHLINSDTDLVVEGNVGIGTTDPLYKLQVNGRIYAQGTGPGNGLLFANHGIFQNDSDRSLHFVPTGVYNYIFNTGNVGIGVANPVEKLEVAGNIKADNIAKGWVLFDGTHCATGTNCALLKQYNVASVFKCAAGMYKINWGHAFSDTNYVITGSCQGYFNSGASFCVDAPNPPVVYGSCTCQALVDSITVGCRNATTNVDTERVSVVAYGD